MSSTYRIVFVKRKGCSTAKINFDDLKEQYLLGHPVHCRDGPCKLVVNWTQTEKKVCKQGQMVHIHA